ncbi:hypothetical protein ACTXT7_002935 [Hymenolepis weldensis]
MLSHGFTAMLFFVRLLDKRVCQLADHLWAFDDLFISVSFAELMTPRMHTQFLFYKRFALVHYLVEAGDQNIDRSSELDAALYLAYSVNYPELVEDLLVLGANADYFNMVVDLAKQQYAEDSFEEDDDYDDFLLWKLKRLGVERNKYNNTLRDIESFLKHFKRKNKNNGKGASDDDILCGYELALADGLNKRVIT